MSLFLSQQKIPFQSVIRYLRAFAPTSQMQPEQWAKQQLADLAVGDSLFVFEPIYSPWGDSSEGIGVAEGDSFKVLAMLFASKDDAGTMLSYLVAGDTFERKKTLEYLTEQAQAAKSNGSGFYYAIARPKQNSAEHLGGLVQLETFGISGWRNEDRNPVDLPYAFFNAVGCHNEQVSEQKLDMAALGYLFFCDKEPPAGSHVPDLREHLQGVINEDNAGVASDPVADIPSIAEAVPAPTSGLRMPSFFQQFKPGAQKQQKQSGAAGGPPPLPGAASQGPPPLESKPVSDSPWGSDEEDAAAGTAGSGPLISWDPPEDEIGSQSSPPPIPTSEPVTAPPDLPGADTMFSAGPPPLPGADPMAQQQPLPPLSGAKKVKQQIGAVPPLPSHPVESAQLGLSFTAPPEEVAPPVAEQPPAIEEPAAPVVTATNNNDASSFPMMPQDPPAVPVAATPQMALPFVGGLTEAPSEVPAQIAALEAAVWEAAEELGAAIGETSTEEDSADRGVMPPLPPKKRTSEVDVARQKELQNRALKEPIAVKSGVAGLVSKLEQQATKASSKLESQVDEIQARLSENLTQLLNSVGNGEKRSNKSAEGLRHNLTGKLEVAAKEVRDELRRESKKGGDKLRTHLDAGSSQLKEKHEYVRTSLGESFDEVRARAETVAKSFDEKLVADAKGILTELESLREKLAGEFLAVEAEYEQAIQGGFDSFKEKLEHANGSITNSVEGRYSMFQGQLADLHQRSLSQLGHLKVSSLNRLNRQFSVTQSDVSRLQASSLQESVMPRLKQHREELRVVTSEFQHKLTQDLDEKGSEKLAEFEPQLIEKKEKLIELLRETTQIKAAIESQLKAKLESVSGELRQFVETSVTSAQSAHKNTEDQLGEIDRAVRALADPSSIEGDLELLNERNEVLAAMDEATEQAKEEVLSTLRTSLVTLEERGKQLQEELITSMEEDAYRVRRTSEQALSNIRDAIRESFVAIQAAQDERMPM